MSRPFRIEDLPPAFRNRNAAALGLPTATPPPVDEYAPLCKADQEEEAALQKICEDHCSSIQGYMEMTPLTFDGIAEGRYVMPVAFYAHWTNNKGLTKRSKPNPTIADLLLFDARGGIAPLITEFKVRKRWQPGQKSAVKIGFWKLAWSYDEWKAQHDEWRARLDSFHEAT